ncbi:hypothetical protein FHG87_009430 [Trinorchestia longiramus]|nr:hypothetical protein FHG87_009430 [Trinorchestia longiramus]
MGRSQLLTPRHRGSATALHNGTVFRDFTSLLYTHVSNNANSFFHRPAISPRSETSVSQSGPYRPPGGVEEIQGGGRRVRLEWGAYITV